MLLDFMSRQQFGIAWLRFQPFRPILVATYLAYVLSRSLFLFFNFVRRIERLEVFAWPLAFLLQQFSCIDVIDITQVVVVEHRRNIPGIASTRAFPRIRRATRIHSEADFSPSA